MNRDRPYTNLNQHTPKRRYESTPQSGPPAKKARQENGHFHKSYDGSAKIVLPNPAPALPSISEAYEKMVFTHPGSTMKGNTSLDMANYDRLEFLGDAYLEIIATRIIFDSYTTTNAGGMCRLRESVVKNDTLSKYSIMYGFDKKLRIQDTPKDGNKGWTKIYGDVFEAYAAAVVLSDPEHGQDRLASWLKELWAPVLQEVKSQLPDQKSHSKEELAKKVMCPGVKLNYVDERKPVKHVSQGRETFYVGVYLDGWGWKNQHLGSGEGSNRIIAGQKAALQALENNPIINEIMVKREAYLTERAVSDQGKAEKDVS